MAAPNLPPGLEALRDIHPPPPPPWWPPAPGWWALAGLAAAALAALLWWRRRRVRPAPLAAALKELEALDSLEGAELAAALSLLLRRLVAALDGSDAAALAGEAWLRHLDAALEGAPFSRGPGRVLLEAPYRRDPQFDAGALRALVRRWIEARGREGRR